MQSNDFFYSGPLNKLHTTMSGKISAGQIFYGYVILVGLLDPLGQSIAAFAIDVWPNLIITVPISTIVLDSETGKSVIIDLIWSYIEKNYNTL